MKTTPANALGPFFIEPRVLQRLQPRTAMPEEVRRYVEKLDLVPRSVDGTAGILRIEGPLALTAGLWEIYIDGTVPTGEIVKAMAALTGDPRVKRIGLDLNSPGGTSHGMSDLRAAVRAAQAAGKQVFALARDMACSGALWLAAFCDGFYATDTATVGNFGAYMVVTDQSEYLANLGIKQIVISSGELKHTGAGPITQEQAAFIASYVREVTAQFRADLIEGRGLSPEAMDRLEDGRWLTANQALALGLIDGVMSRDEFVSMLNDTARSGAGRQTRTGAGSPAKDTTMTTQQLDLATLRTQHPSLVAQIEQAAQSAYAERPEIKAALSAGTPATVEQLEAIAGGDAAFVVAQVKAKAPLAAATAARCEALTARVKDLETKLADAQSRLEAAGNAGANPLQTRPGAEPAAGGDAKAKFDAEVAAVLKAGTCKTRHQAVLHVQKHKPEVWAEYRKAV